MERCVVCDASILSYVHHLKSSPQCFPSITEPGWYESPDNPGLARYWDGEDWDEKSDSRYEVLMYEAFIESMEKQEELLAATRAQSISQTKLLRSIRTIGAWLLILAILGPIALWIATTVIVNAL